MLENIILWVIAIALAVQFLFLVKKYWNTMDKIAKTERERGAEAARKLIQESDQGTVIRNYEYSLAAPDQTDFDSGYQQVIRDWMN